MCRENGKNAHHAHDVGEDSRATWFQDTLDLLQQVELALGMAERLLAPH